MNHVELPVQRNRVPAEEIRNAWNAILTGENGDGWLNEGLNAHRQLDDALYDGVNELPLYGGFMVPSGGDRFDLPEALPISPIAQRILAALQLLDRYSKKGSSDGDKMRTIIKRLIPMWTSSLSLLNEHIRRTGEVGTRMITEMVYDIEGFDEVYGADDADDARDLEPIVFSIRLTSVALLFRQMPKRYIPSSHIPRQPVNESHLSSEIQRFYRVLTMIIDVSRADGRTEFSNSISQVLPIALSSWNGSDCARSIALTSLNRFRHMFRVTRVREILGRCDDFTSIILDVMPDNTEFFGYTKNISFGLRKPEMITEEIYLERSVTGILCSNTHVPAVLEEMSLEEISPARRSSFIFSGEQWRR